MKRNIDQELNEKVESLGIYFSKKKAMQLSREFDINDAITLLDKSIRLVDDDDYFRTFLLFYKKKIKAKMYSQNAHDEKVLKHYIKSISIVQDKIRERKLMIENLKL